MCFTAQSGETSVQGAEAVSLDALARAAVADIQSGMIVGLGTGMTAARGIVALAERVKNEKLSIQCVPTSHASETVARSYQLPIIDFAMVERVDFIFDGADEVDPQLRMLKGKGGAIVRERIVAHAAGRSVYMVGQNKLVDRLGQTCTLPIAVMAFGLASVRTRLRDMGLNGVIRRTLDGQFFLTDNGHLLIDVTLENHNLEELALELDQVAGVADHGLFLTECQELLVETPGGVEKKTREAQA
jgi:ribose 5-phosphate isomerase A